MTQFLRFTDADAWIAAAAGAGFIVNGTLNAYTHTHAIDLIGTITHGGEYNFETGEMVVVPEVLSGWHVNYIGDLPIGWEGYIVTPEQPVRVWA